MLRAYGEHLDASPARLQEVEDRLALLDRLKRKYGPTLAECIDRKEQLARQLEALRTGDERRAGLGAERARRASAFVTHAQPCRRNGVDAARTFGRKLQDLLAELAMARTQFDVRFEAEPPEAAWTEAGVDVAECYLSANVGEDLRPLARIASGGELSRVMLAIRTLAAADAPGKTSSSTRSTPASAGVLPTWWGRSCADRRVVSGALHHTPAADRRCRARALPDFEDRRRRPHPDAGRAARSRGPRSKSWRV